MYLPFVFILTALPSILTALAVALLVWGMVKVSQLIFRNLAHHQ